MPTTRPGEPVLTSGAEAGRAYRLHDAVDACLALRGTPCFFCTSSLFLTLCKHYVLLFFGRCWVGDHHYLLLFYSSRSGDGVPDSLRWAHRRSVSARLSSILFINEEEDLGGWDVDLDLMSAALPRTLHGPIPGNLEQVLRY